MKELFSFVPLILLFYTSFISANEYGKVNIIGQIVESACTLGSVKYMNLDKNVSINNKWYEKKDKMSISIPLVACKPFEAKNHAWLDARVLLLFEGKEIDAEGYFRENLSEKNLVLYIDKGKVDGAFGILNQLMELNTIYF